MNRAIPFPQYQPWATKVLVNPFLEDPDFAEHWVALMGTIFFGGEWGYWSAFPSREDGVQAVREFMIIALPHELAHHVRYQVRGRDFEPWVEERIAMDVEYAVLLDLVARGVVPASWKERYARMHEALLREVPPEVFAALPAGEAGQNAAFRDARDRMWASLEAGAPDQQAIYVFGGMYERYRVELSRQTNPPTLDAVVAKWLAPEAR